MGRVGLTDDNSIDEPELCYGRVSGGVIV